MAWISPERYAQVKHEIAYTTAPALCIDVVSASSTNAEMLAKKDLYFEVGSVEVWLCSPEGAMYFYDRSGELTHSRLIPKFPPAVNI